MHIKLLFIKNEGGEYAGASHSLSCFATLRKKIHGLVIADWIDDLAGRKSFLKMS